MAEPTTNLLTKQEHKNKKRQMLVLRSIEYKQVAKRCINPDLIIKSYNRKMTINELKILLINISEDEGFDFTATNLDQRPPKLKIKKGHRTFYRTRDRTIHLANHTHSMNAHALIHEFAHHVMNPTIWKLRYEAVKAGQNKPSYHGRMFTVYMEYLLHEYRKYWDDSIQEYEDKSTQDKSI